MVSLALAIKSPISIKKTDIVPVWIDEAGNEYCGSYAKDGCCCIITSDGGVI